MGKSTFKKSFSLFVTVFALFALAACNKEDVKPDVPSIEVDQELIENVSKDGAEIELSIKANRKWTITTIPANVNWIIPNRNDGADCETVTLTLAPNSGAGREITVRIATSTIYTDVRITQTGAIVSETLYADNFGTTATQTGTAWPLVGEYSGWNKSGIGASSVTYSSEGGAVSARSNSTSSGYDGASGSVNVMMAAAGASFIVKDIDPKGMTSMNLTFGFNETTAVLTLFYSTDGTTWTQVNYTKTAEGWGLAQASFGIPASTGALHLKFTAATTQYGTRIDDIKLVGAEGGTVTPPTGNELNVSTTALSFVTAGEAKPFNITGNVSWTASVPAADTWCQISPASGSNNGTVTVTVAANSGAARSTTITVSGTGVASKSISITQAAGGGGGTGSAIWTENVGSTASSGNPLISAFSGWTKGGSVGSGVTYEGVGNVSVRTSVASSSYTDASGVNSIFFGSNPSTSFIAKGIAISGQTSVTLTFGISKVKYTTANVWDTFVAGDMILSYSTDGGTTWTPVTFTIANEPTMENATTWALASAVIPVTGATSLSFKWDCALASAMRIDDMKLTGGGTVTPPTGNELNVSTTALSFVTGGEAKPINITGNVAWTASVPAADTWCQISPTSGSNNGTVTVTVAANSGAARSTTITVSGTGVASKSITITQAAGGGGGTGSTIWSENVGSTASSGNPLISAFTGWTKGGSAGSGVTYEGVGNVSVRTSVASSSYTGASGVNSIFFGSNPNTSFIAKGIAISGQTSVTLSFGISKVKYTTTNVWDTFAAGNMVLSYSTDGGTTWTPITFTIANEPAMESATTWALASAVIPVTGATSLSFKWDCALASAMRIDDITLK